MTLPPRLYYILDDLGEPVAVDDVLFWAKWFELEGDGRRQVAHDQLGEVRVSTVFLGLDHNFAGGPPILFETMVFGGPLDGEQYRYHTRREAHVGHEELVERVRAAARGEPHA